MSSQDVKIPDPPDGYKVVKLPFENVPIAMHHGNLDGDTPTLAYYCPNCGWVCGAIAVWSDETKWWYECTKCKCTIASGCRHREL
jgi:hypothetical protein